ncbi:MAG: hypothetical protein U0271_17195 [Polyangiaceae bacterium]
MLHTVNTLRERVSGLFRRDGEPANKPLEPLPAQPGNPFPAGAHPLDWRRSGLSAYGRKVCRAVTEALLADEGPNGELVSVDDATLDRVIHKLDIWLGTSSPELSRAFFVLCLSMEATPSLTIRRAQRFSSMSLADRVLVLTRLEDHPNGLMSMLLTAFKVPLLTGAFEEGELLHSTGYERADLIAPRNLDRRGAP